MATKTEFAGVMAYLSAGIGKEVSSHTAEVYFDLLGDLPLSVLQHAAKRALLEGKYPVLPTVGQLREIAAQAVSGELQGWSEAWLLARKKASVLAFELDVIGTERTELVQERVLQSMPEAVRRAGAAIGWREIAEPRNMEATRAHFRAAYESSAEQNRRQALLPDSLRRQLAQESPRLLPADRVPKLHVASN